MSEVWNVAWRYANHDSDAEQYDTEGEAMGRAEELARLGRVAVVYPIEVSDD